MMGVLLIILGQKELVILEYFSIPKVNEKGQSTVEFALTLVLVLAFVFFYFQLCMMFAFGNYAHYATYMSARAYLSAGSSDSDQVSRSKQVLIQMLKRSSSSPNVDKFPSFARGVGGTDLTGYQLDDPHYKPNDKAYSWLRGVRYTFKSRLSLIPLAGLSRRSQNFVMNEKGKIDLNSITLTSESWLGKEVSYSECQNIMGNKGIFDNGC